MKIVTIKIGEKNIYKIPKKYFVGFSISLIVIGIILFLYAFQNIKNNSNNMNLFPNGLVFQKGFCSKDCIVKNKKNEYGKIKYGTICGYSEYENNKYVNIENENWLIMEGEFVYLMSMGKTTEVVFDILPSIQEKPLENTSSTIIEEQIDDIKDNQNEDSSNQENQIKEDNVKNTPTPTIITKEDLQEETKYFKLGDYIGTIKCENVGLNAQVVYGDTQYIIDTYDIGISIPPGSGKPMFCGGHSTKSLSVLKNIKENYIITIETNYGIYTYTVTKVAIGEVFVGTFGENDFLKDLETGNELFTKNGSEILQIYTCAYFENQEEGPTKYRYAVIANLTNVQQK